MTVKTKKPAAPGGKRIVARIDEGTDRRGIVATTYQMRNCYRQFADGCASELDVHCYFQHAAAADLCPKGGRVLDVCCGRGLLIPFLRYRGNAPALYCGVDIHPNNAKWRDGADPRRESQQKEGGWGFQLVFVESNVGQMAAPIKAAVPDIDARPFDLIVYTSAIEHMQPSDQEASLVQAGLVARKDTILYLSCPVTREGESGYDAQYAAHVYEPKLSELRAWLQAGGWEVRRQIGLCTKATSFREILTGEQLKGAEYIYSIMPREQALPTIGALYPACADEVALVCVRK